MPHQSGKIDFPLFPSTGKSIFAHGPFLRLCSIDIVPELVCGAMDSEDGRGGLFCCGGGFFLWGEENGKNTKDSKEKSDGKPRIGIAPSFIGNIG